MCDCYECKLAGRGDLDVCAETEYDTLRVGLRDFHVVWVLTFTSLPRVWETARVYRTQTQALDAQMALHKLALTEHPGVRFESTVQAAPIGLEPSYGYSYKVRRVT